MEVGAEVRAEIWSGSGTGAEIWLGSGTEAEIEIDTELRVEVEVGVGEETRPALKAEAAPETLVADAMSIAGADLEAATGPGGVVTASDATETGAVAAATAAAAVKEDEGAAKTVGVEGVSVEGEGEGGL